MEAEAGRIPADARVRVSGVVTDDDPERRRAYITDGSHSIAVVTGAGGLAVEPGHRVVLEARLDTTSSLARFIEPLVVSSVPGTLPAAAPVEPVDLINARLTGRRVEVVARVQAAALRGERLHLTITTQGVQLDAELRRPDTMDWRALIGANVRLRGVLAPADDAARLTSPVRVLVASPADLEIIGKTRLARPGTHRLLTSAAAVQALPPDDAAAGHPVKILARVTVNDPAWAILFVQDATSGIFVFTRSLQHPLPPCEPGDLVEIVGETGPGEFAPVIAAHRLTVKGRGPVPTARMVPVHEVLTGRQDSQLVELTGVVRSLAPDDANHLAFDLVNGRERIPAFLPSLDRQTLPAGLGIDAVVRVTAVVGTRFNAVQQIVGVQLFVPTAQQIVVDAPAPADPFELPLNTIGQLLTFATIPRAGRLARVRGVVVVERDDVVFLRDSAGTLEVQRAGGTALSPGDLVEAAGFPVTGAYSPVLEDAVVRRIGRGDIPTPIGMQGADLLRGEHDNALVRIQGRLLHRVSTSTEDVLVIDAAGTAFSAHLDRASAGAAFDSLQNGSVLELTGVSTLQAVRQANRLVPREIRLLLPSADAVRVVRAPPWLTGTRLGWMLGGLGGITLASLAWIATLRRRVRQQTYQLRLAKDAAEAASRAKSQFVANISHEIRTPMNGVLGVAEFLLEAPHGPEQRQYLDMVKSSGEALLHVINDILDFSKIEAGRLDLSPRPFALRGMLDETLRMLAIRARQKNLALSCVVHPDVPGRIVADADRLRQVVLNLAGNAIKFTDRGRVAIDVTLAAPLAGGDEGACELSFTVSDTGIGIPADQQTLVFEAFAQADGSVTRRFGGTGLGLPISTSLVGMMGGSIQLTSEPGHGSAFTFTIRAGIAAVERPEPVRSRPPAAAGIAVCRLRVLVAEDNLVNQKIAAALLERRGHDAVVVSNGREAVAAWKQASFDLIFMDVQMPEMDGLEATATIRHEEKPAGSHVPIIAMTAHAMSGDRKRCLDAGMDDYLTKPISLQEIDRVLQQVALTAAPRPADAVPA